MGMRDKASIEIQHQSPKRLWKFASVRAMTEGSLAVRLRSERMCIRSVRRVILYPRICGCRTIMLAISSTPNVWSSRTYLGFIFCSTLQPSNWGKPATTFATWHFVSPKLSSHCTVGCKFCSMLHPSNGVKPATAFATWPFVNPKVSSHCTVGCKFCSMLHPSNGGKPATAFATWPFVNPKVSSHCTVGCKFCSMLYPSNWGKPATAFATWPFVNPKVSSHCTVGCKFCSMLQPSNLGEPATTFATWPFVSPKHISQWILGCSVSLMHFPFKPAPSIKSASWMEKPVSTRKYDISWVVLPHPRTLASFTKSNARAEIGNI